MQVRQFFVDAYPKRYSQSLWTGILALGLVIVVGPDVKAQTTADVLVNLGNQNDAQRRMALSIDNVCPNIQEPANAVEGRLRDLCNNMVGNGSAILGQDPGNTGFDLDETGLNNALQAINGEEIQAAQWRTGEVRHQQNINITSRLSALRSGRAGGGLSLAGLTLQADELNGAPVDLALADGDQTQIVPAAWLKDEDWSKLGVFVSGGITVGDKEATGRLDGYDFNSLNITIGADYQVSESLVFGGALGLSRYDSDVDSTARSPDGQTLESRGYLLSLFASRNWTSGLFVDGVVSYGDESFDSVRRIVINSNNPDVSSEDRTAKGDFNGRQYSAAVNVGHEVRINAWSITPTARLEYVKVDFDGFTETGADFLNLTYDDFDAESLRSNVGVEATYTLSTDQGVFIPGLRAEYVHEFSGEDDGARIAYAADTTGLSRVTVANESTDEDFGILGASIVVQDTGGMSAFVDYSTVVALDKMNVHRIKAGIRWEF